MRRGGPCSSGVCDLVGKARLASTREKVQDPWSAKQTKCQRDSDGGNQCKGLERGRSGSIHGIRGARTTSFHAPECITTLFSAFPLPDFVSLCQVCFLFGLVSASSIREIYSGNLVKEVLTTNPPEGRSHLRLSPIRFHWGCHCSQKKSH